MSKKEHGKISIEIDRMTFWRGGTIIFAALFVISLFTGGFGFGDDGSSGGPARAPSPSPTPTPSAAPSNPGARAVDIEGSYFKGEEDASVVLVEFSDFQCPFCQRFYTGALAQIESTYVDTGKIKFVYKDFPLDSIHPQARPAANAARCAGDQGSFWEYHNLLFENQGALSDSSYVTWAGQLGLDVGQFSECYDSKKFDSLVTKDFNDGSGAGVRGTPGFILIDSNGDATLISGAQPFSSFQSAIEAALSG